MNLDPKPICFFLLILLIWEVATGFFAEALFPGPYRVLEALVETVQNGELVSDLFSSSFRLMAGIVLGCFAGMIVGFLMGSFPALDRTISPLLHILKALPPVALIPFMIVWFGIADLSKVLSIAFAVFFPVWLSTISGITDISPDYLRVASLFSKSPLQTFYKVTFPAALPFVVSGIRIGIGMGFIMVFVSELAGASSGLGYFIANSQITYRIDRMMAGLTVLGLLAASSDFIFLQTIKRICPWVE